MARELVCPICNADLPIAGDEKSGDDVFCSSCGTPFTMKGSPDDEDCELVDDY